MQPTLGWGPLWDATCATLMAFRDAPAPAGYRLRPEAAAGVPALSSDRRTYRFTVRPGLRFSDGSPLRAVNFKRALERVRSPAMQSEGAALFSDVKEVSANGRQLRSELTAPAGDRQMRFALSYACPVRVEWPIVPAGVPLTLGPGAYYISNDDPNSEIDVERNPYYRDHRRHRVDRIVLTMGGDLDSNVRPVEEE